MYGRVTDRFPQDQLKFRYRPTAGGRRLGFAAELAQPLQGLLENGGAVFVAAAFLDIREMGLVRLVPGRGRRVFLVATGRQATTRAVPFLGNRRIRSETRLSHMPVRAKEGDRYAGGGLAPFRFTHRASAYPTPPDRIATSHCN